MTTDTDERTKALKTLAGLIREIPVAMLTTNSMDKSLHSRPMINVNREFNGELWFFTLPDDSKVVELKVNTNVNVSFASPSNHQYVSVAGSGEAMRDNKRAELLWTDGCESWFPSGAKVGDMALIRVEVESAEYWDAKKSAMVAMGGLVRRVLTGDPTRSVDHETVEWPKGS